MKNERKKARGTAKSDGNRGNPEQKAQRKPAKLGRDVQARLGQQLRAMYDDVVNQGVPDRFNDLIDRLDGSGKKDQQ